MLGVGNSLNVAVAGSLVAYKLGGTDMRSEDKAPNPCIDCGRDDVAFGVRTVRGVKYRESSCRSCKARRARERRRRT